MEESEDKKTQSESLGKWILKNLLGAVVFFVILLIGAQIILKVMTHHGQTIRCPT